jgi:hypothetical protein
MKPGADARFVLIYVMFDKENKRIHTYHGQGKPSKCPHCRVLAYREKKPTLRITPEYWSEGVVVDWA